MCIWRCGLRSRLFIGTINRAVGLSIHWRVQGLALVRAAWIWSKPPYSYAWPTNISNDRRSLLTPQWLKSGTKESIMADVGDSQILARQPRKLSESVQSADGSPLVPIAQNTERECPKLQVAGEIPAGDANLRVWFNSRMRPCQGRDDGAIPFTRSISVPVV